MVVITKHNAAGCAKYHSVLLSKPFLMNAIYYIGDCCFRKGLLMPPEREMREIILTSTPKLSHGMRIVFQLTFEMFVVFFACWIFLKSH